MRWNWLDWLVYIKNILYYYILHMIEWVETHKDFVTTLSGVLAGFAAFIIAWKGLNTWRREKEYTQATDILKALYKVKDLVEDFRFSSLRRVAPYDPLPENKIELIKSKLRLISDAQQQLRGICFISDSLYGNKKLGHSLEPLHKCMGDLYRSFTKLELESPDLKNFDPLNHVTRREILDRVNPLYDILYNQSGEQDEFSRKFEEVCNQIEKAIQQRFR